MRCRQSIIPYNSPSQRDYYAYATEEETEAQSLAVISQMPNVTQQEAISYITNAIALNVLFNRTVKQTVLCTLHNHL